MAVLAELPPELILHTVSLLTRYTILDPHNLLAEYRSEVPELVPDLPSINALSQTNTVLHCILNQTLYDLCASVETLGKLALLFAVKHQLESTVDRLVAAGISLDTEFAFRKNCRGFLHIAAIMGLQAMVVKLLGMYGQEMMTKVHARRGRDHDTTALDYAVRYERIEIVRLLAPIPMPSSSIPPRPVSDTFETHEQYLSLALMESAKTGNREISEYLVSEGADVNFLDERISGGTPLYYAAGENLGIVQSLLASGADPNLNDKYGFTPLSNAANMDIAQALVDAGANVHAKSGCTHYNMLVDCANIELLRFFLERGVDPNLEDDFGQTPLHHVCSGKHDAEFAKASVELLLQFGAATVEKADRSGCTPMDIAMGRGRGFSEVVKILEPFVQNPDLKLKISS